MDVGSWNRRREVETRNSWRKRVKRTASERGHRNYTNLFGPFNRCLYSGGAFREPWPVSRRTDVRAHTLGLVFRHMSRRRFAALLSGGGVYQWCFNRSTTITSARQPGGRYTNGGRVGFRCRPRGPSFASGTDCRGVPAPLRSLSLVIDYFMDARIKIITKIPIARSGVIMEY